jgi:uncharacterized membrane protein
MSQPIDTLRSPDRAASSDERVLAGVAHLAICGGIWLIAPLLIFFLKRKDSPFVAFHALQATLLALAIVPITLGAWMLAIVAQIAGVVFLGDARASYLFVGLFFVSAFAPMLLVLGIGLVAGVRAFGGSTWSIPFVGRFARSILAAPQWSGRGASVGAPIDAR